MDITISKEELSKVLSLTQSIVERKTTMPILTNLLLSVSDGELKISATDLEVTAISKTSAEVRSGGSTTVNAKVFAEIVRELPDGAVTITLTDGDRVEITCGNSRLKMIGISAEEYPSLPGMGYEPENKMPAHELLGMINSTLYAVSMDETRFNLNGVCFSSQKSGKETTLKMVATDRHRLALITRATDGFEFDGQAIVPRKGLSEIRKLLDECGNAEIGIDIRDGFLLLDTASTRVSMRLIDGEFPDYKQVLPKQDGVVSTVSSTEIAQSLKRVALMVTDKGKCVKLDFAPGSLRVSSSSSELGEAVEELDVDYDGEPLSVGFNAKYIMDYAASLGEDQRMCIELNGALGPGKFYAEGDESYIGIIMPMRLT